MSEAITAAPSSSDSEGAATESRPAACLNCGTPLSGAFCAACGQRDVPAYPTVRELAKDAFSELSGWDGRFAVTLRRLIGRPGMLTREFLEGRRARYVSPLRLYLVASVAYFVVASAAPDVDPPSRDVIADRGLDVRVNTGAATLHAIEHPSRHRLDRRRALDRRVCHARLPACVRGVRSTYAGEGAGYRGDLRRRHAAGVRSHDLLGVDRRVTEPSRVSLQARNP